MNLFLPGPWLFEMGVLQINGIKCLWKSKYAGCRKLLYSVAFSNNSLKVYQVYKSLSYPSLSQNFLFVTSYIDQFTIFILSSIILTTRCSILPYILTNIALLLYRIKAFLLQALTDILLTAWSSANPPVHTMFSSSSSNAVSC